MVEVIINRNFKEGRVDMTTSKPLEATITDRFNELLDMLEKEI